jgi:anti-sigma-K factor RskA
MTGPACRDIRQALGIYVVGAIDPAERTLVDIHLSTCPDCREELAGLAGLPALLGRVPASDAERLILHSAEVKDLEEPPAEMLNSLIRRVAERRAVRRWRTLAAAAAAVVIALAGGAAGARIIAPSAHPIAGHQEAVAEVVTATNPRTHVSAIVSYTAKSWGTRMDVWVAGIKDGTSCEVWAVNASGQRWQAGSWTVPGGPEPGYPASVSLPASQLRSFEITLGGRVLVTVPAT